MRRRSTRLRGTPEQHREEWLRLYRKAADLTEEAESAPACSALRMQRGVDALRFVGIGQGNLFWAGSLRTEHDEGNDRTQLAWKALGRLQERVEGLFSEYLEGQCGRALELEDDAPMTPLSGRRRRR